jgi:hypothetical protein
MFPLIFLYMVAHYKSYMECVTESDSMGSSEYTADEEKMDWKETGT